MWFLLALKLFFRYNLAETHSFDGKILNCDIPCATELINPHKFFQYKCKFLVREVGDHLVFD